jgi:glycosyltransferase involved in cell wall biosynthesis
MRLVLLDPMLTFASDQAFARRPRGGIAQATVYLADALAGLGHEVTLACGEEPGLRQSGVAIHDVRRGMDGPWLASRAADGLIVLNDAGVLRKIAPIRPQGPPALLWVHHLADVRWGADGRSAHGLDTENGGLADAVVFVSSWQRDRFLETLRLDPSRSHVILNAAGPEFCKLQDAMAHKRPPWRVVHTPAPYKGLSCLLDAWPLVQARHPEAILEVYSGLAIYGNDDDPYAPLYERCRAMEGAVYQGPLPHGELAARLKRAAIFAHPSLYAETSCIAALEALAAGCRVVATDLGALPETCDGRARLIAHGGDDLALRFAAALSEELSALPGNLRQYSVPGWDERAREWEQLIRSL